MSDATIVPRDPPAWAALRRYAFLIDQTIGVACEAIGATLVVAEVCILFAGVVSRYVLDSPLFWTDELANFLFLWLSMLGMVVALRRDGHMRLTTVANWAPPHIARWFAAVAALVVITFVLEILLPATQYVNMQRYVELVSLQISDGYRVTAILVGFVLAAVLALLRLLETTTLRSFGLAVLTVGGIAALLWIGRPLLLAMGFGSLIVFFVVIVAICVVIGVPIAFAFGIATMSYLGLTSSLPLSVVVNRMDEGMSNLLLLSVPMFVFLGLADGDGRHRRSRDEIGVPSQPWSAAVRRPGLCAAGCDVSGLRHLRLEGQPMTWPRWHPCCSRRCGAEARILGELAALLASSSADVGNHSAEPGADHHSSWSPTISITALFTGGLAARSTSRRSRWW